ncbi:MAG TPA: hypothetical protein VGV09_18575 [Steroidobacteraceae bacterium]|nr:hypothetical protein [Steroidobacteraceae bacterium]
MASFRKPGPIGLEGETLPAAGTLSLVPASPPGLIGSRPQGFAQRAGAAGLGMGASVGTDTQGSRSEIALKHSAAGSEEALNALPNKFEDFGFQGRTYRILPVADWRALDFPQRYQIVPLLEARTLLETMSVKVPVSLAQRVAFRSALELVGDATHAPSPSTVLLLRVTLARAEKAASSEPAITPSQMKALRQTHWITIQLVDTEGNPVADEPYVITTPDNSRHSGTTDESGIAHLDGILDGQCKISFPNRDQNAWS